MLLSNTLGKSLSNYSREFFEFGCVIKARKDKVNTFVEITVNDRLKRVEVYYNKDFGKIEKSFDVPYRTYINNLYSLSLHTNLVDEVEQLINENNCSKELR